MKEIRKKQYELEAIAEAVERINNLITWYQHTDEITGEMVDDENEDSVLRLAGYRAAKAKLLKVAGV